MFNAQMLTLAREAAGLTQLALAPKVGVSQAYVSQLEHGFKVPTDELVERLADVLELPPSFFEDESRVLGDSLVEFFHKKRLTLPVKPLRHAHAIVNVSRLEVDRLLRGVDLVQHETLPTLSLDELETPEQAASLVRAVWRAPLAPLQNLTAHVESMGIPVLRMNLIHRKLSAITVPLESGSHLIFVNDMLAPSDQRFAIAHEVAHLALHGSVLEVGDLEGEADEFAGALLLPATAIASELRRLEFRDLGILKARWQVPMKALIYRARQLGVIDEARATGLYKQLSAATRGQRREPGEFEPESPRLVRVVIEHLRDRAGYTLSQVASIMRTSETRLRTVYLGESAPPPLRLVDSNRPRIVVPDV